MHAYADRIVIKQDGLVVGEHSRRFGRNQTAYDPWHYVPVLARKPGALRNGAPFKDWPLPASIERVRRKLKATDDGDRQMVKILTAVLTDGLQAVEAACAEAKGGVARDWAGAPRTGAGVAAGPTGEPRPGAVAATAGCAIGGRPAGVAAGEVPADRGDVAVGPLSGGCGMPGRAGTGIGVTAGP